LPIAGRFWDCHSTKARRRADFAVDRAGDDHRLFRAAGTAQINVKWKYQKSKNPLKLP
jgi:hypothetical protein